MKQIIFVVAAVLVLLFSYEAVQTLTACSNNVSKIEPVSLDAGVTVVVDQGPEIPADAGMDANLECME
jgi:hypothetical protein